MTNSDEECLPLNEEIVQVFWEAARQKIGVASMEELFGPRIRTSIRPPAVQLSPSRAESDRQAELARSGELTSLTTPLADIGGEGDIPRVGDLLIVCDGAGLPRALLGTTNVTTTAEELVEEVTCLYPPLPKVARTRSSGKLGRP